MENYNSIKEDYDDFKNYREILDKKENHLLQKETLYLKCKIEKIKADKSSYKPIQVVYKTPYDVNICDGGIELYYIVDFTVVNWNSDFTEIRLSLVLCDNNRIKEHISLEDLEQEEIIKVIKEIDEKY